MDESSIYKLKEQLKSEYTQSILQSWDQFSTSDVEQFGWTWCGDGCSGLGDYVPIPEWTQPIRDMHQQITGMVLDHLTFIEIPVDGETISMADNVRLFKGYTAYVNLGPSKAVFEFCASSGRCLRTSVNPGDCLVTTSIPRLMWSLDISRKDPDQKMILAVSRSTHLSAIPSR